jgi:hypothetical protein
MTPEQEDEANWFAGAGDLTKRLDIAISQILGRKVPWALAIWPHPNKTLLGCNASEAEIREGFQGVIDKFDTMRFEIKK